MKYYTDASGGLASGDASGVVCRYTTHGWTPAEELTLRTLGRGWWPVSASEAVELARVIDWLPRPV